MDTTSVTSHHSETSSSSSSRQVDERTRVEIKRCIQEWIRMDNELAPRVHQLDQDLKNLATQKKQLMAQRRALEERKKEGSHRLLEIIKGQNVGSINVQGGQIVYKRRVTKKNITKKYLLAIVDEYYGGTGSKEAEQLATHILESRGENVKETIERRGI